MSQRGAKNLDSQKKLFPYHNPLKSLKTAKGILGKAWRFQGKNLEKLGVDLEKLAAAPPYLSGNSRPIA
jgi:hypothetical protein